MRQEGSAGLARCARAAQARFAKTPPAFDVGSGRLAGNVKLWATHDVPPTKRRGAGHCKYMGGGGAKLEGGIVGVGQAVAGHGVGTRAVAAPAQVDYVFGGVLVEDVHCVKVH
jgi:hypothetical protein